TAGINSRLDEMQAALLRAKLAHLAEWTERRRAIAARYQEGLAGCGVALPTEQPWARAVWHLFVIRHPRRDPPAAPPPHPGTRPPPPRPDPGARPARVRRAGRAQGRVPGGGEGGGRDPLPPALSGDD